MIEEISGAGGGGKDGGGSSSRAPIEAPNTLRSAATARIIDMLGEGPIVGLVDGMKSVFLDDTPLQNANGSYNFRGAKIYTRSGEANQTHIPGFASVENEVDVSVQVKASQPLVRMVTNLSVDAVRIKIRVPTLTSTDTYTGDIKGARVKLAVDVMPSGGVWKEQKVIEIAGKTTSPYERQARVELVGQGPWNVRVRRLTSDSSKSALQNETYWSTYTEITDAKLTYPDSALVGIEIDARQFGNKVPARSYDVKGRIIKVPGNYDPTTRAYTGLWNGTFKLAWTDNPAWIFYDIATHPRYGGKLASVDKWAIYQIGQYCDELVPDGYGGMEPRFTINTVLAEPMDAIPALSQIASAFRGMVYWGTNTAVPVADMPADPVKLVTPANVIGGEFEYSGTALRDRHSAAAVTWNDPEDNYRKQVEIVEDPDAVRQFGWRQIDITAFGCTSRGQAHRLGKWILYSERSETETVTYKAGTDHLDARPGDVIAVSDPATAGARMGGRVVTPALKTLVLDAVPNNIAGSTWYLDVVLPSGGIERRKVTSFSGNSVTLETNLTTAPVPGAMWVLSSLSLQPRLFRIISVSESDGPTYQITAAEYNPTKYDQVELGMPSFDPVVSLGAPLPSQVVGLKATDSTYRSGSGISTKLIVSWERSDDVALTWEVKIRDAEDGNWEVYDNVVTPTLDVPNVTDGATYVIECYALNSLGGRSTEAAVYTHTVLGKTRPPADVTGFVSVPDGSSLKFTWDSVPDVDVKEYEVRYDDEGWGNDIASQIAYKGPATSFTAEAGSLAAADTTLFIKAVDTSGNYSELPGLLNVVYVKPSTPSLTSTISDTSSVSAKALIQWPPSTSNFPIQHYLVTVVRPDVAAFTVTQNSTYYELPMDFLGNTTVSVVAVDTYQKQSNSGAITINSLLPASPTTATFTTVGIGILRLEWDSAGRTSLPIDGYEVRTSNSGWGEAGAVYRGSSPMCSIDKIQKGNNVFYIKAFDTEGRFSTTPLTKTYSYSGPVMAGDIVADFGGVSAGNGMLNVAWPESVSPFGLDKYVVKLNRPGGLADMNTATVANSVLIDLNWVGDATFSVTAYDKAGNSSEALTKTLTRLTPAQVPPVSMKLVSYAGKKMTVLLDWPETGVMTTLPIAGYEVREADSGWGGAGYIYKGLANQTTVAEISTTVDTAYYLRAYDINGAYSGTSQVLNILKNVGPEPVTEITAKPSGQNLRIAWKASLSTGGDVKYEIRTMDANWGMDDDDRLYYGTTKYFDVRLDALGSHTFFIRALDKFWEYSLTSEVTYDYTLDKVSNLDAKFGTGAEPTVVLKWDQAKPAFGLSEYVVFDGTETTYTKTNSITKPATWSGSRTFTVAVRDRNQLVSATQSVESTILLPTVTDVLPTFKIGAAKNGKTSVTLDWANSVKTSLPIKGYEIRSSDADWGTGEAVYYGTGSAATIADVPMDTVITWYLRSFDVANNYSASSLVITSNGESAPDAVTGFQVAPDGTGVRISWNRSDNADVVEYEVRTSDSGWGTTGFVYKGTAPEYLITKPPTAGATYYVIARDAYKQVSPTAASVVFTYPTPVPPSAITAQFSQQAGTVLIDWPDTNPVLGLKHYKVIYKAGTAVKTSTTKASTLNITTSWTGGESVDVIVVDTHGVESAAATYTVGVSAPGTVPTPVVTVVSIKANSQTVKLDWAEAAAGSFKVAGYEVRTADSGWGGSGHVYKGASSQATLSNVSTSATTTWYVRAYDARGNYSDAATSVSYTTVLPPDVSSVTVKRSGATLALDCVTGAEPDDFSHVQYRVGKVVAGATAGDDTGVKEGVLSADTAVIWEDPDVQVVNATETSNKANLDFGKFGKPLLSKAGILYKVEARMVDKGGNFSPNSAKAKLVVKSLS